MPRSYEKGFEFNFRGRLWAEVVRKGVISFICMIHCKKLFQSEKLQFIYFMGIPSTAGLLL